jgi:hypothetical protein
MTAKDYLRAPEEVDMAAEERGIRIGTTIALLVTIAGFVAAYQVLPMGLDLPTALPERLAFAVVGGACVTLVVMVAILMVSTTRRFSPADIGGQAAGPPSEKLAVKSAFLQNTLEQAVIAWGFFLGLAALAGGAWLALIPVSVVLFWIGRVLFYLGYERGGGGRALGMSLTMMPSLIGYIVIAGLMVARLF